MRKTLLFLMLLSVKLTFGQFSDDFSDGNFTVNPSWTGHFSAFNVNNSKQLQTSLSSIAQSVSLSTANQLATNVKWEFFVQLNFDPSTSNQTKIYLIADIPDLNGPLNGYFIQIGENGSADSYDLYKQTGLTVSKIIDGPPKNRVDVNKLLARIRVTRSELGRWELYTDIMGGNNFALEGEVTDLTFANTNWFGIQCKYTVTRSDGFIFDDFSVEELTPDVTPPTLLSAKVLDEHTVEAIFSERLTMNTALINNNYRISNLGMPSEVIASILPNVYHLIYPLAISTGDYKLTVNNVEDLKGNSIVNENEASFFYLKPYQIKKNDILISEVLVNPKTGGVDFIEIYNNSNHILDLKELQLANVNTGGAVANIKNVSSIAVYMPAKTYWVLTTNPTNIKENYDVKYPDRFIQMSSLPAYNNDMGSVLLLGSAGVLERFDYNEKMHAALLKNADGVALERVSFRKEANDPGNFKSAAMAVGFATPTYQNSQVEDSELTRNQVMISNKIFSPDGDNFEDHLKIDYLFVNNGQFATINIYSDKGMLVRKLQKNVTIGTAGNFIWDGLNDTGQQSKMGIYVVKFDVFALNGKSQSFRQTCVLAKKLN